MRIIYMHVISMLEFDNRHFSGLHLLKYNKFTGFLLVSGFPKLVSLKTKASKTLFTPIKPTNPSVRMAYEGQNSS